MSLIVNPIRRKWVGSYLNVVAEHKRPPAVSVSHSHASENGSHLFISIFPKVLCISIVNVRRQEVVNEQRPKCLKVKLHF